MQEAKDIVKNIDPKTMAEYQKKFKAPKVLIMQWLGLKPQKSQFVNGKSDFISS